MTRPVRPIRLIALDLDGTVVGPDREIRPRVRGAVGEAMARGVEVVIVTGRMYRSALRFATLLGLRAPLVCYQGAYVREIPRNGSSGDVLRHTPLPLATAREAILWARARGLHPHVNLDDRLLMQADDPAAQDYERALGVGAEFVPDLLAALRRAPTKVLAVGTSPLPEQLLPEARATFQGRAEVTVSHPEYLEWTARGVHKGRGLAWLARRVGVPLGQVMAIGDQYNDLELLARVGHGVAMGDAPPAVQSAARYVTASFEADGAALAIEALALGRGSLEGRSNGRLPVDGELVARAPDRKSPDRWSPVRRSPD